MREQRHSNEAMWSSRFRVSVVIPALNEAENLPHVLPLIPTDVYEVILVDGRSTDNTEEVARKALPNIRIVQQLGRGKGDALRTGFAAANGEIIVMLDADGSTDPTEIPRFVGALLAGADFVKGSRFLHGGGTADMPYHRALGNMAFVAAVRLLFGGRYSDLCYGYNAFWKSAILYLELDGDGFEIETMMNVRALRAGFNVVEVPSFEAKRIYGDGRLRTIPDGWRVLKTIWRERRTPVRLRGDLHNWDRVIVEEVKIASAPTSVAPRWSDPVAMGASDSSPAAASDADYE